tara:strand:+ start:1055 stop:2257 length:1203 start_codon:yes stop_codon:yes gene_type:complete
MLSNKFKFINTKNCQSKKNIFNLVNEYDYFLSRKKTHILGYITYLKDNNDKDRLVYSARIGKAMDTTWYDYESTRICEISNNKIINDKQLIFHNNISHNLSLFNDNDTNNIIGYGGCYATSRNSANKQGIFSFNFNNDSITNIKVTIPKKISLKTNYVTAFDSNICCLKYKNKYYVYTRYNEGFGRRKTQLFISDSFDSGFKVKNLITFDDPTIFTYTQTIFIENGIFIGIFRIYRKKNFYSHQLYDSNTKINYLVAHSFDGLNFTIDNEIFIPKYNIYDIISTNYKKTNNKKSFFFSNKNNIIKETEIRDGGYIYYENEINSTESQINLQVLNNKETILLNYTILEEGYINIFFIDENKNEISKKELLIKDHTNNVIDLPTNCKFVNIKFNKSKIYQIL